MTLPRRRSPGLAGGVSASQSGGQLDADEGLLFSDEIEQERLFPGAIEECIFAFHETASAVGVRAWCDERIVRSQSRPVDGFVSEFWNQLGV